MKSDKFVESDSDEQPQRLKMDDSINEEDSDDGIESLDGYTSDSSVSEQSDVERNKNKRNSLHADYNSGSAITYRNSSTYMLENEDSLSRKTQTSTEFSSSIMKPNPESASVMLKECRDIKVGPQVHFHDTITINQNFINTGNSDSVPLEEMNRLAAEAPSVAARNICADPISVGVTIQQVSTTEIRPSKRFFAHSACCKRVFKGIMTLMVIVIVVNVIVVIVFLGLKRDEEPMKRQAPPTKKKVNCSPSVIQDLARVGCYDKLKRELAKGVPVNKGNRNGSTFLHKAAHGNQVKIAKLLLDRGADIEAARNNGETPLHTAALWGSLDMARFLIQRGANLNPRIIPEDLTPLQLAAKRNYLDIVKQLVLCGADYSLTDKDGMTAQRLAEKEGKRDVAEWLGSYSARPHPEVNDTVCRSGNATTVVN